MFDRTTGAPPPLFSTTDLQTVAHLRESGLLDPLITHLEALSHYLGHHPELFAEDASGRVRPVTMRTSVNGVTLTVVLYIRHAPSSRRLALNPAAQA